MKAATVTYATFDKIEWPAWGSPKIDGIRCLIHPTLGPVTTSFKPVPNEWVREELVRYAWHSYLDGELAAVDENGKPQDFNRTQSAIMSHGGQPAFEYRVFDCFEHPDWDFSSRYEYTKHLVQRIGWSSIKVLSHEMIDSIGDFIKFTDRCIEAGYEGSIIRAPAGIYKNGRSTRKQGWLLKYKEWADAEGLITGFVELMHNSNPDVRDKFDLAKRSSAKEGMIPMGTLGALQIETKWGRIYLGSGFDQALRQEIWTRNMDTGAMMRAGSEGPPEIGRYVVFKYQPHGMKDLPRFPIFKGFREEE